MKTLVIMGSPRRKGNGADLLQIIKDNIKGEIIELWVYKDKVGPCIDCRYCSSHPACSIKDDMQIIYDDDFDNVIIITPVYMSTLPGPLVSLGSRFQVYYAAKRFAGAVFDIKPKKGGLILTGGGDGKPDEAIRICRWMLRNMGCKLTEENLAITLNTDEIPALEDKEMVEGVMRIIELINED